MTHKADHVRAQGQTRAHTCHWPGCRQQVPPAKWGCAKHWFALPEPIRKAIWQAYRPGQEIDRTPSRAYVDAARAADDFARRHREQQSKGTLL